MGYERFKQKIFPSVLSGVDSVPDAFSIRSFTTSSQPQSDEWKSYNTEFGFIQENVAPLIPRNVRGGDFPDRAAFDGSASFAGPGFKEGRGAE